MTKKRQPTKPEKLRLKAEQALNARQGSLDGLSSDDVKYLLHELQVHQIQLEMQNEELIQAQEQLQAAHDQYSDLYDFAPVAYLTVNQAGHILEANLTAASWLNTPRSKIIGRFFSDFVDPADQDKLYLFLKRRAGLSGHDDEIICLMRQDKSKFYVHIDRLLKETPQGEVQRLALTDITERKRAERALQEYHVKLEQEVEDRTTHLRLANSALQESREQLQLAVDLAAIGYWLLNLDLGYMQWGGQYDKLLPLTANRSRISGEGMVSTYEAFLQAIHPDDRVRIKEVITRLVDSEPTADVDFRVVWPSDGRVCWVTARVQAFRDAQGRMLYIRGVMHDVTEHIQEREAEREQRRLAEALIEITADLNGSLNLAEVLQQILRNLRRVLPHDTASILLLEDGQLRLSQFSGAVEGVPVTPATRDLADVPFLDQMLNEGQPFVIESVQAGDYWLKSSISHRIRSYICAPIFKEAQLLGIINVESFIPESFNEADGSRLKVFVQQAALAIWNAYACLSQQEVALLQERQRMAMELHDAVSQTLWSANVIAEALPDLWAKQHPSAVQKTEMLGRLTKGTLAEMRALLLELRPSALEMTPLDESLRRMVEGVKSRTELNIIVHLSGPDGLPAPIRRTYYRVAQEALNNAVRHAQTDQIEVILICEPSEVTLSVVDNGIGFDTTQYLLSDHYGLSIMRERAEAIGAAFSIESTPGQGTRVTLRYQL